jgi:alpha-1,6-mannosyltransferase
VSSRRLLLAGVLGSALVATGQLALVLSWLGVALLGVTWWASRRLDVRHQRAAGLLWALPLLAAPPLYSQDLHAYAGQAALVAGGLDPYAVGPGALPGPLAEGVDDVWLDAPAPYGPVWLALAGLVVRITGDAVTPAVLGLRLLAVLGVGLIAWALGRLAADPSRALWLGVANPLVLLHFVAGGHNDALMVGLLLAGLALTRPAVVVATVLVTLAALVKAPALAGLAYLPLLAAERVRAAVVVPAVAGVTAVAVSLGTGLGWGWLGTLDAGRARLSLLSPLTGLGTAVGALDAVLLAGLVAAAVLCVVLLALAALGRLDPLVGLGLSLLGVSVLLPVVQPWYLLWGACVLAARVGPRAATALGAASLVLCLAIAPSGRHVVRPPLHGLPTLLAGAAAIGVLARARPHTTAQPRAAAPDT